jgi:hypothetical protein
MSFLPSLFLSHVKSKDGLARPARFQVIIPIPNYINSFVENSVLEKLFNLPNSLFSDLTTQVSPSNRGIRDVTMSRYLGLQCESAELPGKTLQTADVSIYGPSFKVPYLAAYTETTLNFICTNDFYERKLFDRWLEAIIPNDTNNPRFPKGQSSSYMTNIKIIQYDDFIKQIYAVELIDAFPIGIASQALSWSDDNFHRLSVQFTYQKFKTIYDGTYDLRAAAGALFGGAIAGVPISRVLSGQTQAVGETLGRIF